jgi:hypothetical protein
MGFAKGPLTQNVRPHVVGMFRCSAAQFLAALILLLLFTPFLEQFRDGDLVEAVLLTLVLSSAVMTVGGNRRTLMIAAVVASPSIVSKWANHFRPDLVSPEVYLITGLVFVTWVAGHLLRYILRAPRVDSEMLCAGISGYLTLALVWTFAYVIVARTIPRSFATGSGTVATLDGFTAIYLSFMTLTTTGYGDLVPASNISRLLAMLEAMTGVFYVAIVISRLVALYSSSAVSAKVPALSVSPFLPPAKRNTKNTDTTPMQS